MAKNPRRFFFCLGLVTYAWEQPVAEEEIFKYLKDAVANSKTMDELLKTGAGSFYRTYGKPPIQVKTLTTELDVEKTREKLPPVRPVPPRFCTISPTKVHEWVKTDDPVKKFKCSHCNVVRRTQPKKIRGDKILDCSLTGNHDLSPKDIQTGVFVCRKCATVLTIKEMATALTLELIAEGRPSIYINRDVRTAIRERLSRKIPGGLWRYNGNYAREIDAAVIAAITLKKKE